MLGQERYKGITRMTFLAGRRTLTHFRAGEALLRETAATLGGSRLDVPAATARLRDDLKAKSQALGAVRADLMRFVAEQILAQHPPAPNGTTAIPLIRDGEDIDTLRVLASELTKRGDVAAFLATKDRASGDWVVVVRKGATATIDCGRWLKHQTGAHGGRGGGRPEHAEGRMAGAVDWAALVAGSTTG